MNPHSVPTAESFGLLNQMLPDWFVPDVVRPDQFVSHDSAGDDPERALMLATLQLAWEDAHENCRATKQSKLYLHRMAVAWFESTDTEWPFSFENCCQVLGLDPDAVRAAVRRKAPTRTEKPRRAPRLVCLQGRRLQERHAQ